jgi:outer membrane protein assembly factor BamB
VCLVAALIVAGSLLSGCGGADDAGGVRGASDWALPNADLRNTRHVGGPIDASSVSRLARAWSVPIGEMSTTPLVVDGIVYVQDLRSNVEAIDLGSGKRLWRRTYDSDFSAPNGVTFGDGRLYGATPMDAFALDARSGEQIWSRRLVRNGHEGIDIAPGYRDGTVYVSTVPVNARTLYGHDGRGVLWALDGASGRPRWSWNQVPPDLWGHPEQNSGGGMWHPPAFDERGGLYAAIANPAPFPGTPAAPWGASRPGPNRWTNSLVKLDAHTGRFLWGRQVLPHDLYDWDLECPPILVRSGGRLLVLAGGKMGFAFAFDAITGERLWKTAVGDHNGHDEDNLAALRGDVAALRLPVRVLPGEYGGIETPMAIDDDTLYVPVVNRAATFTTGYRMLPDPAGTGEVVAIDVATGRVRWERDLESDVFGGATVVNDLVMTTTFDGRVWALRTDSGEIAWSSSLPAGSNAPLVVAGDTVIAAAGEEQLAGQHAELVAYRLGK